VTPVPREAGDRRLASLDHDDRRLWAVTLLLILVQCAAILILYLPEVRGEWDSGYLVPESKGALATSLCGLTLLFCLYMLNKQSQMRRLGVRLAAERLERAQLSSRLDELTALFEVATRLHPHIPVEDCLQALLERLVPAARVAGAGVFLRSGSGNALVCAAAHGELVPAPGGAGIDAALPPFHAVLGARNPVRGRARELGAGSFLGRDATECLALPIGAGAATGAATGVLVLARAGQPFLSHEESLLRLFADHLGHDMEHLAHVEHLEERATRLEARHRHQSEREREEWRFFAAFHQEIRSALALIAYRVESCERGLSAEPAAVGNHLVALSEEVRRLASAVQEAAALLDVDPMAEWILHAPVAVNGIVEGAVARVAPLAGSRGVVLRPRCAPVLPLVGADATRLGRVLVYYLSELLRRTPEGGALEITTELGAPGAVRCVVDRQVESGGSEGEVAPRLPGLLLQKIVEGTGGSCEIVWGPACRGVRLELPVSTGQGRVAKTQARDPTRRAA
jgi:GAF domain-containing protein